MKGKLGNRDNKRINSITDINLIIKQDALMTKLGLNYAGYRDLLAIYNNYLSTQSGLKVYGLIKMFGFADTNYRVIFERLTVLKDKGLIQSVSGSYIPTDKAIQLLNSISV